MILLPATFKPCHLDPPDSAKMHGFRACSLVERQVQGSPSKSSWPCHNLYHSLVYRSTGLPLSIETHQVESIVLFGWCSFFLPEIFPACSCYILTKAWGFHYISTTTSLRNLHSIHLCWMNPTIKKPLWFVSQPGLLMQSSTWSSNSREICCCDSLETALMAWQSCRSSVESGHVSNKSASTMAFTVINAQIIKEWPGVNINIHAK